MSMIARNEESGTMPKGLVARAWLLLPPLFRVVHDAGAPTGAYWIPFWTRRVGRVTRPLR